MAFLFKIVIADHLAPYVDKIFDRYYELSGGVLFLGALLFSIQIYCDFCGYSLVAIGVAKIINFNLSKILIRHIFQLQSKISGKDGIYL